ncbi:dUTP diphosphatase [Hyphomicrobium sp.]|uniref:dUTP diphosphatase n=1 Tax=Hyphomicrobium sp. TaxID=82 RepID=UPI0025C228DC|nr:dUTP diphosphatase [Hyphomicrobium sp.]MCC7254222.1 dUTP diphosphatase [Hyphomicrobium sp.]
MTKSEINVRVVVLAHGKGLPLPAYQSDEAAGLDLLAAVGKKETVVVEPGARALVPTGLTLELPAGYEGQVRPRSGLALKHGVTVLNSPGTIDSDYRGEVKIILINLGDAPFPIRRGDRIAQLVVAPVTRAGLVRAKVIGATRRGSGGFGSTKVGKSAAAGARSETVKKRKKSSKSGV